ncbi:LpxI family protein, partial [Salipiger sp. HF18]
DALTGAEGGVLYKAEKPGQDTRVDLPVIGPRTARGAIRAGLAGIVVSAGGVMVLDRDEVLSLLDEAGLFLWVRERP